MSLSYPALKALLSSSPSFSPLDDFVAQTLHRLIPLSDPRGQIWLMLMLQKLREGRPFFNPAKIEYSQGWLPPFEEAVKEWIEPSSEGLTPIVKVGQDYILQKHEDEVKTWLAQLKIFLDEPLIPLLSPKIDLQDFNDEQRQAVELFFNHRMLLILGGPGRGKTFTAQTIVKQLIQGHPQARIICTAPTGKAVENFTQIFQKIDAKVDFHAATLHSLLQLSPHKMQLKKEVVIDCDLLIVDESSMIDFHLMTLLLQALSKKAAVILLGDSDQLPPVRGVSPLQILPYLSHSLPQLGVVELKKVMRTDKIALVRLADGVRCQDVHQIKEAFNGQEIATNGLETLFDSLAILEEALMADGRQPISFSKLYQHKILTTHNVGPYGADAINAFLMSRLAKRTDRHHLLVPILFTVNDDHHAVFNGKLGYYSPFSAKPFVLKSEQEKIPHHLSPAFELAFALSVHKSQGSEFNDVSLVIQEIQEVACEMLYTAVSRAKQHLAIYGDIGVFFRSKRLQEGLSEKYLKLLKIDSTSG